MESSPSGRNERLSLALQLERKLLVCPVTRQPLSRDGAELVSNDGSRRYPLIGDVPILQPDPARRELYKTASGGKMYSEYLGPKRPWQRQLAARLADVKNDYRSAASLEALAAVTTRMPPKSLCLSIGGGPKRVDPGLVNLNIDLFDNVDVVGDAYLLPYGNGVVDAIHCEAVLEHLERPDAALAEAFRVLRSGGFGYFATPFLQPYHAYPGHYQNFTLEGHDAALMRAGFHVLSSGCCVGPTFALVDLVGHYFKAVLPTPVFGRLLWLSSRIVLKPMLRLDKWLSNRPASTSLASTVFALVTKLQVS